MVNLMVKELRLNVLPGFYLFLLFGALLLIPTWTFYIAFAYIFLLFLNITQLDRANADLMLSATLPIRKAEIVYARALTVVFFELATILVSVPFAVARHALYSTDNQACMNTNLAFYGTMMLMFGLFNVVYFATAYTKPYRLAWPLLGGTLISLLPVAALDTLVMVLPQLAIFNDRGLGHLDAQLPVLAVGLVVWAGLTWLGARRGAKAFAQVDL